jgi:uncharacterized protein YjdB
MKPLKISLFFLVNIFQACVGTDYLDDPVIQQPTIALTIQQVALMPGQMVEVTASYVDKYGIERDVELEWVSENSQVATVSPQGKITAIGAGQTTIVVLFENTFAHVEVNVVDNDEAVATVEVVTPKTELGLGETIQLAAIVRTISGGVITGKVVEWFSENDAIATVNHEGLLTGVSGGVVEIHAKVEGVKSNRIDFTVLVVRTGMFVKAGGYQASGTATMRVINNQLILELGSNFQTSFALGTFIYLSNTTSGSGTLANGVEIKQITTNGAHSFNVSQVNATIGLYDYRYVVILCKPASVTFGYADMN